LATSGTPPALSLINRIARAATGSARYDARTCA
jgi:hypothetical protein